MCEALTKPFDDYIISFLLLSYPLNSKGHLKVYHLGCLALLHLQYITQNCFNGIHLLHMLPKSIEQLNLINQTIPCDLPTSANLEGSIEVIEIISILK